MVYQRTAVLLWGNIIFVKSLRCSLSHDALYERKTKRRQVLKDAIALWIRWFTALCNIAIFEFLFRGRKVKSQCKNCGITLIVQAVKIITNKWHHDCLIFGNNFVVQIHNLKLSDYDTRRAGLRTQLNVQDITTCNSNPQLQYSTHQIQSTDTLQILVCNTFSQCYQINIFCQTTHQN